MIRILALIGAAVASLILLAATAIANHGHIPLVSGLIRRLLPISTGVAAGDALAFWLLQLGCYLALSWILTARLRAHTAHPDPSSQRPDRWMAPAHEHLTNSAPGWPAIFAILPLLGLAVTAPLALAGQMSAASWGTVALFTVVLVQSAIKPDKPVRLLPPEDSRAEEPAAAPPSEAAAAEPAAEPPAG